MTVPQGLPYAVISFLIVVMYKNFHLPNGDIIFYSSLLLLPWALKPLWAPFLESLATQKQIMLFCQALLCILFLLLALSLFLSDFFVFSLILLFLVGLTSATQDIAIDGYYLSSLKPKQQAGFVGVRTLFYQLARLSCQGGLVVLSGVLMSHHRIAAAWQMIFVFLAALSLMFFIYHCYVLKSMRGEKVGLSRRKKMTRQFFDVWSGFLKTPHFILLCFFLLFYNFAEAQLLKVAPLFFLSAQTHGGLGLGNSDIGFLFGLVGVAFMILGALISGWIIQRSTLAKCLPVLTLLVTLANLGYLWLACASHPAFAVIGLVVGVAQFCFGLTNSAYMAYLLQKINTGKYRMSYYSIGSAIMVFGTVISGAVGGFLLQWLSYVDFFTWVFFAGLFVLFFTLIMVKHDDALRV